MRRAGERPLLSVGRSTCRMRLSILCHYHNKRIMDEEMLIDAKIEALSLHEETKTETALPQQTQMMDEDMLIDAKIEACSTLVTKNMQLAHEKYDDFVDVSGPLLTMSEFQTRRSLPLNAVCRSVL